MAAILLLTRKIQDIDATTPLNLDVVGCRPVGPRARASRCTACCARASGAGCGPKPNAPDLFGLSLTMCLILAGLVVLRIFGWWEQRVVAHGREPLVDLTLFRNARLDGGLVMFFFQFLIQAGLFFTIPLFLSVALGLSALETGVRLLPLSVTLLLAAVGIPRLWPQASPRRVVNWGLAAAARRHRRR